MRCSRRCGSRARRSPSGCARPRRWRRSRRSWLAARPTSRGSDDPPGDHGKRGAGGLRCAAHDRTELARVAEPGVRGRPLLRVRDAPRSPRCPDRVPRVRHAAPRRLRSHAARRSRRRRWSAGRRRCGATARCCRSGPSTRSASSRAGRRCARSADRLFVKDESRNPTGSFKARGLVMAVSMARALGARALSAPSAGNAAGALAAYGAAARDPGRRRDARRHAARVRRRVPALRRRGPPVSGHDRRCRALAARARSARQLRRLDAQGAVPDRGQEDDGVRAVGAVRRRAARRDRLSDRRRHRPRRHVEGVRRDARARLAAVARRRGWSRCRWRAARRSSRGFAEGAAATVPWADPQTRVWGLRVPSPLGGFLCLRAIRETGGTALDGHRGPTPRRRRRGSPRAPASTSAPRAAPTFAAYEALRAQRRRSRRRDAWSCSTPAPASSTADRPRAPRGPAAARAASAFGVGSRLRRCSASASATATATAFSDGVQRRRSATARGVQRRRSASAFGVRRRRRRSATATAFGDGVRRRRSATAFGDGVRRSATAFSVRRSEIGIRRRPRLRRSAFRRSEGAASSSGSPAGASFLLGWAALRPSAHDHVPNAAASAVMRTPAAEMRVRSTARSGRERSSRVLARIGRDGRSPAAEVVGRRAFLSQ